MLQFTSGGLIYFYKVGFSYENTLAYYKGTQEAQKILGKDFSPFAAPFFEKRSFYGLVKIACAHMAAYGILCFILTHFLRSLSANATWANVISYILFVFAFLELLSGFAARYGPDQLSFIRLIVLYLFIGLGCLCCLCLFFLASMNQSSELSEKANEKT